MDTPEVPMSCPHMSGDNYCTICRDLMAYRLVFDGTVETMLEHEHALVKNIGKMMGVTLKLVRNAVNGVETDMGAVEATIKDAMSIEEPEK